MKRKSRSLIFPFVAVAVIVLMVWGLFFKTSPSPPKQFSRPEPDSKGASALWPEHKRTARDQEAGWRILYRDNWEYKCPVLGRHVVDPEEACFPIAAPARLGPIVIRDASVAVPEKPFTTKRDPLVPLIKYDSRDPVMSLPEYVGPRFYAERMLCAQYPGKWMSSHRPVVDPHGRLIRYDPEQVRIFCGRGQ